MTVPLTFGQPPTDNTLYFGDCLDWMSKWDSESVDLVYLDPPFNSKQNYNLLYSDVPGDAQAKAFEDTWLWDDSAEGRYERFDGLIGPLARTVRGLMRCLGRSGMLAYLTYMAERLEECHRLLKPTGSIYLHCDPTASHYLKAVMDAVFGARNFRNEIIWKRTGAHGGARRWGPIHDVILFYTRSDDWVWNRTYQSYDPSYVEKNYRHQDKHGRYRHVTLDGSGTRTGSSGGPWRGVNPTRDGRHWAVPSARAFPQWVTFPDGYAQMTVQERLDVLDDMGLVYWPIRGTKPHYKRYLDVGKGNQIQDVISDIGPIGSRAAERLGYPTQKPISLLERIVKASSNPGDLVLDPFCGCGTTIEAAERLGRRWAGIDISLHAVNVIRKVRMPDTAIAVNGIPTDMYSARHHARHSPFRFEQWAVECIPGFVANTKQRGDGGVDGWGRLAVRPQGNLSRTAVAQVKGGKWKVDSLKAFCTVTQQRRAAVGCFITLDRLKVPSARQIRSQMGHIEVAGNKYQRMSLWSIEQYFDGETHGPRGLPMLMNVRTGKPMNQESLF